MPIERTAAAKPPVLIEDFERLERIGVRSVQANQASIDSERRSDYVRFGSQSLRLEYDFTGTIGTSCAYVLLHDSPDSPHRTLEGYPRRIGVWLYGNTGGHWLRGLLVDSDHEKKPIDFTAKGELCWEGWKYVSANVPEGLKQPIKLVHLYVVETENDNKDSGVCYMDGLVAEYEEVGEDWSGPEFSDMQPRPRQTVHNAEPIVSAIVVDNQSGVDESSLLMTVDGMSVSFSYDADSGRIVYTSVLPLNDGEHEVVIEASDRAGNPAVPKARWSFVVDTSPDMTPPVIRIISPLPGTTVNTDHPRIAAAVEDDHAGVDFRQVRVWLEGQPRDVDVYNGETVFFTCREKLAPLSEHQVRIVAADNAGNRCECSWSFRVGALPGQPRIADRFSMTVIGDGGYYTASSRTQATAADLLLTEQMSRIRLEPSELIGYTGDIVDNDTAAGYAEAIKRMSGFGKPYLLAIGNHEVSGTGSRRHFQHHFGDPTYAYVYGNTLMIVLDSASGHLTRSDASQWLWLENELMTADLPNVFIFMHVPPDQISPSGEDYKTGHGFMDKMEAQRFYDLLGSFKQGRPETNVFVFSGDFHVYQHKLVQGVHYIISGGGGKQAHIAPEKGGYYHYLNVHVDGATVTWEVIPLLESIDWPDGPVTAKVGAAWKMNAAGTFMTSTNTPITLPIGFPFKAEWSSERADIAAVDQEGNVTALAVGETYITVKCGWTEGRIAIKVVAF